MKHSEDDIQKQCVQWFRVQYPDRLLYMVPNEGKRSWGQVVRHKKLGMVAGIPDLVIAEPAGRWHGLYVEMKAGKNPLTDAQVRVSELLVERGYYFAICRSFEEFQRTVRTYFLTGGHKSEPLYTRDIVIE